MTIIVNNTARRTTTVYQEPDDYDMREQTVVVEEHENTVDIYQEGRYVTLNIETLLPLAKFLRECEKRARIE